MKERLAEQGPVSRAIGNELLESGEVEFLLVEQRLQNSRILTGKNETTSTWEKPLKQFSECLEHATLRPIRHLTLLCLVSSEEQ